jgi:hypothetical protein
LKELMTLNPTDSSSAGINATTDYMKAQLLNTGENSTVEDDNLMLVDEDNPLYFIELLENKQYLQDINTLRLLECFKKYIIGFNAIDIFSGKNKLAIGVQDFEIFELLPDIYAYYHEHIHPKKQEAAAGAARSNISFATSKTSKPQYDPNKPATMEEIFKRNSITRNKKR